MAAAGKPFSDSVKDSDCFFDFPCSPCEKDGRNVEAIKYCADCDENLCQTCLTHHNKFAMMRGHKLLDQVQTSQGQSKQLPSQRCNKHGRKIIDVFCPEHDTVGCSTCISVDHSSCKGKKFIPDVSAGIKTSQELKQLETEIKSLTSKFDSLKKLKGNDLQRLRKDKDALKKEIQFVRKKMNHQLDKMEKDLLNEAETKFKQKIDAIHTSIANVDDMLARLNQAMDQLKGDSNDADIFVSCKITKRKMSDEIYPMHARVDDQVPERSLKLYIDENTELIMEAKRMFASIKEKYTIQETGAIKYINIDPISSTITALCALPDGCIAMADYGNKKLKRFDPVSKDTTTLISLPDNPTGLCRIDNTCLAVSLFNHKRIQFVHVSLDGQVTLGNSFTVSGQCRELVHCDGLLYVCCGSKKEDYDHVQVYNISGQILLCLYSGPF